jgi:hypothetical protein
MSNDTPAWKIYERVVASFEIEAADIDVSVTPNATLLGSICGAQRMCSGNSVPGGARGLHRVIDGRPAFDLLTIHLFEEKFLEELIDERCVNT